MKFRVGAVVLALGSMAFAAETKEQAMKRINEAANVFQEINSAEDKGIPQELLERAQCIGIIPGMKRAGFVIGGNYGKGVIVCRTSGRRGWSGPEMVRVEGGSFGLQIGAGETDVVFVVMSQRGMDKLMQDKFTVGGDASAMAGPVGRSATAKTDAMMHAEILSYSRARGVFAGITLNGSTLRPETDDNRILYGSDTTAQQILSGGVRPPSGTESLYTALNRYAGTKKTAQR